MGLKQVQSNNSKYPKPPNNKSQVKENDKIIEYFGKNIKQITFVILRSETLKTL